MASCFHCGLPAEQEYSALLNDHTQHFCCLGCQAVASAIVAGGLADFYQFRDQLNLKPESVSSKYDAYDLDDVQSEFVVHTDEGAQADLAVTGISCAACAWLIEQYLMPVEGVIRVSVNSSNHRCRIVWDPQRVTLSHIMQRFDSIGYKVQPAIAGTLQQLRKKESRVALLRLGIAGMGMMQVGMVSIALHAGTLQGMSGHWQYFLQWVSLLFATPVILYSAFPFFYSAFNALKMRRLIMDLPVSIALILAYGASVWATVMKTGEVYFDSVSMFTFFLLAGRYLEMRARHKSALETDRLTQLLPMSVQKIENNEHIWIPLKRITIGDHLWISSGAVFPCDGKVIDGESSADESLLTGEVTPQPKTLGDSVNAGSLNGESALTVEVTATLENSQLAAIDEMVQNASHSKPAQVALADTLAAYFVAAVLLLSVGVGGFWWWYAPQHAFWIVLSVLVVTCPCALSLATPTALTSGTHFLRRKGLLVTASHVLETLNSVTHVIFDKTGTLTSGELALGEVILLADVEESHVLRMVAAMEHSSTHPIAKAFSHIDHADVALHSVKIKIGHGVEGQVGEHHYKFGKRHYALDHVDSDVEYPGVGLWQLFTDQHRAIAWVKLNETAREGIPGLLASLKMLGITYEILSGDRHENVSAFAHTMGIANFTSEATPDIKLQHIRQRQADSEKVMMVGDGLNDIPVLVGADVSVAMGHATELTQTKTDSILLNENLNTIIQALHTAQKVRAVIKQNLAWALLYNLVALPAAVMGYIPPYIAALGMSLSSLIVVVNSLRLNR